MYTEPMTFAQLLTRYRERSGLTKTQVAARLGVSVGYVINLESHRRKAPTFERIENLIVILGLSKPEAAEFLRAAADDRVPENMRDILVKDAPKKQYDASTPPTDCIRLPLLGRAPAGPKVFMQDEIEEWIAFPRVLARNKRLYMLRISGDSMNLTGAKDGTMIIVDADAEPENGDIVVARIDEETTVKKFFRYDKIIVLRPDSSNPVHKEQTYTHHNDIALRGVVKGIWGL